MEERGTRKSAGLAAWAWIFTAFASASLGLWDSWGWRDWDYDLDATIRAYPDELTRMFTEEIRYLLYAGCALTLLASGGHAQRGANSFTIQNFIGGSVAGGLVGYGLYAGGRYLLYDSNDPLAMLDWWYSYPFVALAILAPIAAAFAASACGRFTARSARPEV